MDWDQIKKYKRKKKSVELFLDLCKFVIECRHLFVDGE